MTRFYTPHRKKCWEHLQINNSVIKSTVNSLPIYIHPTLCGSIFSKNRTYQNLALLKVYLTGIQSTIISFVYLIFRKIFFRRMGRNQQICFT